MIVLAVHFFSCDKHHVIPYIRKKIGTLVVQRSVTSIKLVLLISSFVPTAKTVKMVKLVETKVINQSRLSKFIPGMETRLHE